MSCRKSRRTVLGHLGFLIVGCIIALSLRRCFGFPPLLTWTVFAAAGVVFARDLAKFFLLHWKLARRRGDQEAS